MTDKFVPFAAEKHLVRADCRLCGWPPFGSVVFRSRIELDALLAALTELRSGWDNPQGHIHLQGYGLGRERDSTQLEVMFETPA